MKVLSLIVLFAFFAGCGKSDDTNELIASGTIEATDVTIAAKIPAQILNLYVDEGSKVDSGSLLAVQDHSSIDIQLREAEAAIAAARAQLTLTEQGARSEDIRQAEEAVSQADANRKLAANEFERVRNLEKGGAATREQLEQIEARFRVAQSQLDQVEQNAMKVKHFARPEEVSAASARVQQLEATRDRVRKMVDDSYILSPVNGIVTHKIVEQGELASTGSPIVTITDLRSVHLTIYITEQDLPRVKLGESVDVQIDGMPNKAYRGTVIFISPEAAFTPKNIQTKDDRVKLVFGVKIEIPNPSGELKAGLPADATIHLK